MREKNNRVGGQGQALTKRILPGLTPEHFRLPGDGRKWAAVARQRRALLLELAAYGDRDGSSIFVGVPKLVHTTGWSRATICRRLDELKTTRLLLDDGARVPKKPRRRRIDLARAGQVLGLHPPASGNGAPSLLPELWADMKAHLLLRDADLLKEPEYGDRELEERQLVRSYVATVEHAVHQGYGPQSVATLVRCAIETDTFEVVWDGFENLCASRCDDASCPFGDGGARQRWDFLGAVADWPDLTVGELARAVGVNETSIVALAQSLGWQYREGRWQQPS